MGTLTLRREDGRIVCERCVVADRAHRRMRGLMGRRRLSPGQGMVIRPAFAIHTHFMRFPIDAVFLDSELVVIAIERNLRPWRTASCRGAREVVELAAGECDQRGLAHREPRQAAETRFCQNDPFSWHDPSLTTLLIPLGYAPNLALDYIEC